MVQRGRKPAQVINMNTKEVFESVQAAADSAGVSKSKMYNHIHMVGASQINGHTYCYHRDPNSTPSGRWYNQG